MLDTQDGHKPKLGIMIGVLGGKGESKDAYKDEENKPAESDEPAPADHAAATRKSAVADVASALGADPKKVDLKKLDSALAAFMEACEGEESDSEPGDKGKE